MSNDSLTKSRKTITRHSLSIIPFSQFLGCNFKPCMLTSADMRPCT